GLEEAGELRPPRITVTERAAEALRGAIASPEEYICLEIDRDFQPGLSVGPRRPASVVVTDRGVRIALDRLSAGRAEGVTIDYVETPQGAAFKIDNPNEPPRVRPLTVRELAEQLEKDEAPRLIDVRTTGE